MKSRMYISSENLKYNVNYIKNKIGNNINSQEMESNILNTNYYELITDIEIKSKKNQ